MICGALLLASALPDDASNNAPFGAHIIIDCRKNAKFRHLDHIVTLHSVHPELRPAM